jgi:hypothetical protein
MPTVLVPIRINLDKFGFRVRETFTWNKNDVTVKPKAFAIQFCHDEELPDCMVTPITSEIEEQLRTFHTAAASSDIGSRIAKIKLSLTVGSTVLKDCFFWDHAEKEITPERFAEMMCADLGLGGSYAVLIAHSIREQLLADRQAALQEQPGQTDNPLKIRNLSECYRVEDGNEWTPSLEYRGATEFERRTLQEVLEGRVRKRALDSAEEVAGGGVGSELVSRSRVGRARKDVSYVEQGEGFDDGIGGRSSRRARTTASYAEPNRYGGAVGAGAPAEAVDPNKAPVVIDYTDKTAFPRLDEVPVTVPSTKTQAMLDASARGPRSRLSPNEQDLLERLRNKTVATKVAQQQQEDLPDESSLAQAAATNTNNKLVAEIDDSWMIGGPLNV